MFQCHREELYLPFTIILRKTSKIHNYSTKQKDSAVYYKPPVEITQPTLLIYALLQSQQDIK